MKEETFRKAEELRRYIKQYNSAMQEITKIETIPGYRNRETKEFTEKAKNWNFFLKTN